ncbi:hypothetical protein CFN78_07340 [Amycolatopsis antarctica]|uniref:G domain-containing protein n=1 Tax=Amycolatopsis antarctica TaxID=1854586 RepID=A0A263D954_9PSEU|nr:GTPase [Amycolatopsis antarctica]OZM74077.1 hypothetical protein CFN78_07340 [Amycolatopsis antarctica]
MTAPPPLLDVAGALLTEAAHLYRDRPHASRVLRGQLARLGEPLRIAVAGRPGTGKSTLVNALVGEQLAPVRLARRDAHFTWYRDAAALRVSGQFRGGPPRDLAVSRSSDGLWLEPSSMPPANLDRVLVEYPTRALRDMVLIDSPALADSGDGERDPVAARLAEEADAVVYLSRHAEPAELSGLRATLDSPVARAAPVHSILVLSRADEIGAGKIDALLSARQLARRSRRENGACAAFQSVVAASGLVAFAGKSLQDEDFAALSLMATVSRADLERYLLSVDTFCGPRFPVELGPDARRALLTQFGLFGIRLAVTLVRTGCDSRIKLSAQLAQRSGLSELREAIGGNFLERREVLKARSALLGLESVLRAEPRRGGERLAAAMERMLAGLHEVRELRLIAALVAGRLSLPTPLRDEAVRLLGAEGTSVPERLGVEDQRLVPEATIEALVKWRREAESVDSPAPRRQAARVVVRTCEGLLTRTAP